MNKKSLFALITAGLLFGGCADRGAEVLEVGQLQQKGAGWNGAGWNGAGWNGAGWNGAGWNGAGWNGAGWNGAGWNGAGWNGAGWNGVNPDWDLSFWVNGMDLTGDGFITNDDREAALQGLSYWTSCACPSGTHPTWKGWNPYLGMTETHTFHGNYGLAPTWCLGTGTVPVGEQQAVSACIFASINTKGDHVALSMRGSDNSLKLIDNEKLFMSFASEQYWGNIWDLTPGTKIYDYTDGNYYPKSTAYACYFPWGDGNWQLAKDLQTLLGRTCAWDGCNGPVKTSNACLQPGTIDGSYSAGHDVGLNPVLTSDPPVGWGGIDNGPSNQYQDVVTGTEKSVWRGNAWRRLSTFLGAWADLEVENWKSGSYRCSDLCGAGTDGCSCYKNYCSGGEGGGGQALLCERPSQCNNCQTIVRAPLLAACGTSTTCAPASECVRNHALSSLNIGCWLQIEFLRPYDLLTNTLVSGVANTHKAGTLAFRYANGSGVNGSILIRDRIRSSMIPSGAFAPTASWNDYELHTVYPIYPGRSSFSGAVPGVDIEISANPASPAFPYLDYAQLWVGPPYGVQPREMYWENKKYAISAGVTVCSVIPVDTNTDFAHAGKVRFRPRITGVDPSQLSIKLEHDGVAVAYDMDPADRPWSRFTTEFEQHQPTSSPWKVCVYSTGPKGTLEGADLEMEQM